MKKLVSLALCRMKEEKSEPAANCVGPRNAITPVLSLICTRSPRRNALQVSPTFPLGKPGVPVRGLGDGFDERELGILLMDDRSENKLIGNGQSDTHAHERIETINFILLSATNRIHFEFDNCSNVIERFPTTILRRIEPSRDERNEGERTFRPLTR